MKKNNTNNTNNTVIINDSSHLVVQAAINLVINYHSKNVIGETINNCKIGNNIVIKKINSNVKCK